MEFERAGDSLICASHVFDPAWGRRGFLPGPGTGDAVVTRKMLLKVLSQPNCVVHVSQREARGLWPPRH